MIRKIALLAVLPMSLAAEPVAIRGGEHATFSRLVLSIGVGTAWNVSQSPDGYLLELAQGAEGFDLSRAFDRIPRDRIEALTQIAPNTLKLDVSCACYPEAFLWRPGELVLDIVDGENPNADAVARGDDAPRTTPLVEPGAPAFATTFTDLFGLSVGSETRRMDRPALIDVAALGLAPTESLELSSTEAALLEGMARAATKGFLDAAITTVVAPPPMLQNSPSEPATERDAREEPIVLQRPGIGIFNAGDRDLAAVRDALSENLEQQCLSSRMFDVDAWGDDRPFHEQVAELAEALAGEFGEEPVAAQEDLARLYLHFGFGAEARAALSSNAARSQNREVLGQLAGLIDGYAGPYPLLEAQGGCETPGAFWAFFSAPTELDKESRNQVIQQFFLLPQPLRGQIAPRLARKFVEIDDPEGAEKVMRAADKLDAGATHDVQAARALIAEEFDDPVRAITVLSKEADDNARITPQSLIRLIELELENGRAPRETDLVLAAGMRQEFRGTQIARDLAVAESLGHAELGAYETAFDLLKDRDDDAALSAVNTAFIHLTQNAPAATFLSLAFESIPEGTTPDTENGVAKRLIDLGFPERAITILAGPAEREAASERRYLRAEAEIATQNYVNGLEELLGMNDARAQALRATAYTGLGDHRAALSAAGSADTPSLEGTLQFRAGAWERLTVKDDEVLSAFAQTVLAPPQTEAVETLADRREILEQSQESRAAVEALLRRYDGGLPVE